MAERVINRVARAFYRDIVIRSSNSREIAYRDKRSIIGRMRVENCDAWITAAFPSSRFRILLGPHTVSDSHSAEATRKASRDSPST